MNPFFSHLCQFTGAIKQQNQKSYIKIYTYVTIQQVLFFKILVVCADPRVAQNRKGGQTSGLVNIFTVDLFLHIKKRIVSH